MKNKDQNKKFQLTENFIQEIIDLINNNDDKKLSNSFVEIHHAYTTRIGDVSLNQN